MIVVDLDGTILNEKRQITKNTINYLHSLKEKGFIIVIATGRIYASSLLATEGATFANYLLTDAGTCIYDLENNKVIKKDLIRKETIEKIFSYYDDSFNFIDVCDQNHTYKYIEECHEGRSVIATKDLDYILTQCNEITHAAISLKDYNRVPALYTKLKKEMTDADIIIMQDSFKESKWLEILPKGCNKWNAITYLAETLSIKVEEIMAFGDGGNDIEMIKKCGFGIAMKNALPSVKEVAKDITKFDYKEEGVIKYLEKNFRKNE